VNFDIKEKVYEKNGKMVALFTRELFLLDPCWLA
jgi:hypothetical protein